MTYIYKALKKGCGLLIVGPFVGLFTFLTKHWLLNSASGLALLAGSIFSNVPLLLAFSTGYAISASLIGLAQQAYAFAYNYRLGQCEMMVAPLVPEISYAAFRGILAANYVAVSAESEYQNKDSENTTQSGMFYGENTRAALLYSAGHIRCAQRTCAPSTWIVKEEQSRSFRI